MAKQSMQKFKNLLKTLRSNWYVWLFPIFALLLSAYLFQGYLEQQGPVITIHLDDAGNLQPNKTTVRYRGVTIGTISKITFSEDKKEVIVHVTLRKDAEDFAVEGSRFWVVTPKVNIQGISGLETLFEGPYIAIEPGSRKAAKKFQFSGQSARGVEESLEDTSAYLLEAPFVESINVGDPVTFRGLTVGSVTRINLSRTSQNVLIQINIENRYTRLVRTNTVFWRKMGIQADLGLFKSEVKISSLDTLLRGGIDLFTPEPAGPMAKARARFALLQEPPKEWEKWNPKLEFEKRVN